ncbi:Uncharacterized protein Adt_33321 [Abeliophyllum distichum]|uniref:CCHC-type domain-containing protein n=1 Tax=Abeliophyllum distichum TaxID=126358 RepID=A0ABD1QVX4_9LAMI
MVRKATRSYQKGHNQKRDKIEKRSGDQVATNCTKCGKNHSRDCLFGKRVCYTCHKPGHLSVDCPTRVNQGTARAFALAMLEAGTSNNVVTGTIYIKSKPVYALFNSRATHSFIARSMLRIFELATEPFSLETEVIIPSGPNCFVNNYVPNVLIEIKRKTHPTDLISLDFKDFAIILGMDWLSRYQVTIDCRTKTLSMPRIGTIDFPKPEKTLNLVIIYTKGIETNREG